MILSMRFSYSSLAFETFKVFGKLMIYANKFIRINNINSILQGIYKMLSNILLDSNTPREVVT